MPQAGLLTINAGSSSLKVAMFRDDPLERLGTAEVAGLGDTPTLRAEAGTTRHAAALANDVDHDAALAAVLAWIDQTLGRIEWRAVGHRVTHGRDYAQPRIVDAEVRAYLESLISLAPLHQPHNLAGIAAAQRIAPHALQVACFDTSFHRTMPEVARRYAVPRALGVEVYGFHGLSYEYIASILPEQLGARADGRVIVAHLGSGASMCAMQGRRSVATTMGLTPLDGLPMSTRVGAIDPGAVLYLIEARGMSVTEVRELLYRRSGLLGVSEIGGSMKELIESRERGAAEAVELFVYRAAEAIGSLAVALGGLDAIVFTAGIGEHSAAIRQRIVERIAWLGAELDPHATGPMFSTPSSRIAVCALHTDEELVIARHTAALLR